MNNNLNRHLCIVIWRDTVAWYPCPPVDDEPFLLLWWRRWRRRRWWWCWCKLKALVDVGRGIRRPSETKQKCTGTHASKWGGNGSASSQRHWQGCLQPPPQMRIVLVSVIGDMIMFIARISSTAPITADSRFKVGQGLTCSNERGLLAAATKYRTPMWWVVGSFDVIFHA